ncbi:MAG TPA: hypothetical protein DEF47_15550 [Herpetosiphon sp.]|uniref:Transcriptional regulator, SARP family n=1 Tax=Herpetosiphon aurantiacus (strain ATCC 23779 / DSM 785 / 114-95) TaxID=316274 RepID=A9B889_HERA2|nr:bacterial transcriptional activator domain-containing protein [Herpetosiphon sp.]ABX06442.1 transcriptional regulator, SARP family [Herpetosiphon aurantiacus DSM 785]HBW51308.1 hypothetical protein [Herpetosiphon sp.]
MQQVVRVFHQLLPDFVDHVSEQIVANHVPVYASLPQQHVKMALYNAIHSIEIDLAQGTTSTYADYWREVAVQRAQQGISPVHSMLVTHLSTNVMTQFLKQALDREPEALAWWLERTHTIISLGMLVMTEARINALQQLGQLGSEPASSGIIIHEQPNLILPPSRWQTPQVLHLQAFGQMRAWRGSSEVLNWGRKSAIALLGILITQRGQWIQREQICDLFWPDLAPNQAEAHFKVALNALTAVLEPERPTRQASSYIQRRNTAYRLAFDTAPIQLDVLRFEQLLQRANHASNPLEAINYYRQALNLYAGDFLGDCLYSDWANAVREQLRHHFVQAACELAQLLLAEQQPTEALEWAEAALQADPYQENAYQASFMAYAQLGNRVQLQRSYQRCQQVLEHDLGLAPMPTTKAAYQRAEQTLHQL